MIATQLFNFTRNRLNAAAYRLNLRNVTEDSTDTEVESLYFLRRFKKERLRFSTLNRRNIIDGLVIEANYKSFAFFLNYLEQDINSVEKVKNSFYKKTKIFFKNLNKEILKLKENVKQEELIGFTKYNKIKIINLFKEKEFLEKYDLKDFKTERTFLLSNQCNYKHGAIETKRTNESKVDIVSINVNEEASYISDELSVLEIDSNTSYMHRDGYVWNYIVGAKEFLENGQILPHKVCSVEVVINLDGFEEINNFILESGSSLPYEIESNSFKLWKENKVWETVTLTTVIDRFNYKEYLFDLTAASKIKFKLLQKKYHDTGLVIEDLETVKLNKILNRSFLEFEQQILDKQIKRIYDLSILNLEVKRKANHNLGFYREAEVINISKPLSVNFKTLNSYSEDDCFIEKYLHIVLYGDAEVDSFKKALTESTQRKNIIVPVPHNNIKETEVIVFDQDKVGKLNFTPKLKETLNECIKVYENDVLLNMFSEYEFSFDEGVTYIEEENAYQNSIINNLNKTGSFFIRLKKPIDRMKVYKVEYLLASSMHCDEEKQIFIKDSEVNFVKQLQESIGFVRPVIVIRNKSTNNASSLIKELQVLVEEKEIVELETDIEYETFVELETQGVDNVV